jgi:hypothetical protein
VRPLNFTVRQHGKLNAGSDPFDSDLTLHAAMSEDGTVSYTTYSRAQLVEALSRIDRSRYPRNFAALNRELQLRDPDSADDVPRTPARLPAIVFRYSLLLIGLQVGAGVLQGEVRMALAGEFHHAPPATTASLIIRFVVSGAIALAVYSYLAKHHRTSYTRAGAWVAVVVSLGNLLFAYVEQHTTVRAPLILLVAALAFNLVLVYVAGRLRGVRHAV